MKFKDFPNSFSQHRGTYIIESSYFGDLQTPVKECQEKPRLKYRNVMVLLAFVAQFYLYAVRTNIGISIVDMVNNSALSTDKETRSEECPNLLPDTSNTMGNVYKKHGEFLWSPELQGYILGCSYVGFVIALPFMGKATDLFGCTNVIFWWSFLPTLFTLLSPFAAWCNVYLLIVVQSLRGVFQAGVIPALAALIGSWSPISERGLSFTIIYSGCSWGCVAGNYISGLLCNANLLGGWPLSFFLIGGSGIIASIFLRIFMYDSPGSHPKISEAELKYILDNQKSALKRKRPKSPWCSILSSIPVYALGYATFGQLWAITHFIAVHPTFLGTILHYPIQENGLFSALPFLLQFVIALGSAWFSNFLNRRSYMSVDTARKFWNLLSCLGYSLCLLGIYFSGCNRSLTIILSIGALASSGFGFSGCFITSPDMSPNFAASVSAFASTLGSISNFLVPVVVGKLTDERQTLEQWNKMFFISIGVVMSSGILFAVFGSAELQPWNEVQDNEEEETEVTRF